MDERNPGKGVYPAAGSPGLIDMTWLYGGCSGWTLDFLNLRENGSGRWFRENGRVYYSSSGKKTEKNKQPRTA